ncbi:GNAT family N-acetyltransferase [soil metagenome]
MEPEIRRHDALDRYELLLDGTVVSYVDFHDDGDRVTFPHTVTSPQYQGRGFAATVVRAALDDMRAADKAVVPRCWFVAQFIDENPEYRDLLASDDASAGG